MITTKLRHELLKAHSDNCSPEKLYHEFLHYFINYQDDNDHPVESIGNSLFYLKSLISSDYTPEECIRMIYASEGLRYDPAVLEESYVYLAWIITTIELLYKDYQSAVHWARRTLDLVDYFHPFATDKSKNRTIDESLYYEDCFNIFVDNYNFFDQELHRQIQFSWINDLYIPTPANDQN